MIIDQPAIRVIIGIAIGLLGYMFSGATTLWGQISYESTVLGRYTPRFFLFLVTYHIGMLFWLLLIVLFTWCSINNRQALIQEWVARFVVNRRVFIPSLFAVVLLLGLYIAVVRSTDWAGTGHEILIAPVAIVVFVVTTSLFAASKGQSQSANRFLSGLQKPLFSWFLTVSALLLFVYNFSPLGSSYSVLIMWLIVFALLFTLVINKVRSPFEHWVQGLMSLASVPILILLWNTQSFNLKDINQTLTYVLGFLLVYCFALMLSVPVQMGRWTLVIAMALCSIYSALNIVSRTVREGYPLTPFSTDLAVPSSTDLAALYRQENDNLELYLYFFENYRGKSMWVSVSTDQPFKTSHMKYWGGVTIRVDDYDPDLSADEASRLLDQPHKKVVLDGKQFVFVDTTSSLDNEISLYQYNDTFIVAPANHDHLSE